MRPSLHAVLASLVLAGCLAPPASVPAPLPAATPQGLAFHTGFGSWEPTLGVAADGTLFVNGVLGPSPAIDAVPAVLRSRDGGRTWASVGP
ncbi:MAG: hypothetical protein QOI63_865, partial [Thermoplasmata archaeon]|nr:hypothetical protein [Thermoplasmata archaeon]